MKKLSYSEMKSVKGGGICTGGACWLYNVYCPGKDCPIYSVPYSSSNYSGTPVETAGGLNKGGGGSYYP